MAATTATRVRKYIVVFYNDTSDMVPAPRSIGRTGVFEATKAEAQAILLRELRKAMKAESVVGGAVLQVVR